MNTKIKSFLTLIVAIILIGVALSFVQGKMNAIRYTEKLTDTDPLENAPPAVAFTSVALGGFRGLVADYLWLRSSKMQDEGNYFEMVQLADWIVKLQPRYTTSHAFLAWNMAYNVSVTFTGFEDRWRWVKRGIELIRDEALEYNPGDPELFRQLGWIYQHKMGQDLDDANRFYKTEFAKEMIRLFGSYYGKWDLIDKAPTNEAKLRAAIGDKDFNSLKKACAKYSYATFNDLEDSFRTHAVLYPPEFKKELEEIGIADQVELCLRSRWIIRKYRLEPQWLVTINRKYGNLDWRLPEAHAIYWAERGKDKWSTERDNERYFKKLSCDRMIFQSLQAAFESGRLVYVKNADPDNMYSDIKFLEMTPNVSLVDAANACYNEAMEGFNEYTVKGAYGNFLENAIVTLYLFGEKKKAMEYLKLGRTYPHYGVGAKSRFAPELDDFVLKSLASDMESASHSEAQKAVQSYLINAYYQLAIENQEQAEGYLEVAQKLYAKYAKFVEGTEKRRALPPWDQMRKTSLDMAKRSIRERISPELADNLERMLPKSGEKFIPEAGEIKTPQVQ
ncbi:MAG: hypothetical protein IKS67_11570 [Victivallales bacterium]|nr:hypothetical protein [Victivallales bacterium]